MAENTEDMPAFPVSTQWQAEPQLGMSLRDWFAGQAATQAIDLAMTHSRGDSPMIMGAFFAYEFADAMLAERSKTGAPNA